MKPLKHLSDWEKGLRRSAVMAWMSWAASVGIVQAQVCIGGAGWAPTGRTTDDVRNCVGLYACYPPILEPVSYVPVGGCDPEAGACSVRAQVRATFPGNHLNQSASIPYPGSPVMMIWTTSTGGFVGSCGASGAPIWDDIGDTFITAGNFSCADPGAATGTGDYVLNVLVCQGATGCTQTDVDVPVPLTPGAMASELCPPPPPPPPTWDCGTDSCSAGCFGPGGGVGGGGPGGSSAGGGPPSLGPEGDGPGAHLRYRGGGAGHPDHPMPATWNATLGRFWSHDYAEAIVEDPDATHVWLLTSSATFREFTDAGGDGDYETAVPSDEYRKLTKTAGGWELRDLDGMVKSFDTTGRWTQSVDRNGNAIVATYDGGQLVGVTFPDGRSETFAYDMGGRLESITEVGVDGTTTRTWTYTWTGDDLVGIARPDGTAWEMLYDDPAHPSYMTRLTLMGTDLSERIEGAWQYDAGGNVIRTWRGAEDFTDPQAVDKWSFSFDDPALPVVTTVTDPLNNDSTYTFGRDPASDKPRIEQIDGDCPTCGMGPNTQLRYDDPLNPLKKTMETDGRGHVTIYEYDVHGQLTSRVEAFGTALERETTWEYDPIFPSFVTEMTQPSTTGNPLDFRITTFNIDPSSGDETARTEDGFEAGSPFSLTMTKTYNDAGKVVAVDPPGHESNDLTSFTYDALRGDLFPLTRTDPLVGTTSFGYDALNRRSSETDANAVGIQFQYDDLDRLRFHIRKGSTPSEDLLTEHRYTAFGDLFQTVFPAGNVVEYGYDAAGRLTSIERKPNEDPVSHGERILYTLDGFGNRISKSLQRWEDEQWVEYSATEFVYTSRCHLDRRIDGEGAAAESVTEFAYDCEGQLIEEWDANHPSAGQMMPPSRSYSYDDLHRLTRVREPWGGDGGGILDTIYGYDRQNHLLSVTDGEGNVTTYTTSDRDLMTEEHSPVSGTTTYTFGDHGQLVTRVDARGVVQTRTIDAANRTTFVDYEDSKLDVTYTWDDAGVPFSAGRLTSIERDSEPIDFEYDRFGRRTRDGDLSYAYDSNGNRTEISYPDGGVAHYTHDSADRSLTLHYVLPGGAVQPIVTAATYLPFGPLDALDFDSGVSETRAYDKRYHPDRITADGPGGTLFDWAYTTDGIGNPTHIDDLVNGGASDRDYSYQEYQYYLTVGNGPWGSRAWTYDRIGNRLTEMADGGPADTYVYLPGSSGNTAILDQIQLGAGSTRQYAYGPAGHLEQLTEGADSLAFTSDDAGRLAQLKGTMQTSLRYDGRSFLVEAAATLLFQDGFEDGSTACWSSVVGGSAGGTCTAPPIPPPSITKPLYSSEGVVHALINTGNLGQRARTHFYFAGRPIAQLESHSAGGDFWSFLTVDHLGTPVASTDSTGALFWQGGFEPFGADWQAGTPDGASENGLQLRSPGQWEDETWTASAPSTGLYYNLRRWYGTDTGRYSSLDPLGLVDNDSVIRRSGGSSRIAMLYGYADANPLRFFDRDGREPGERAAEAGAALAREFICASQFLQEAIDMGRTKGWPWSHCWISCKIQRECPSGVAHSAELAKEVLDVIKCVPEVISDEPIQPDGNCASAFQPSDFEDNEFGRQCPENKTCEEHCAERTGRTPPPGPLFDLAVQIQQGLH